MARLDEPGYELSADNREELRSLKRRLEHCALDAPDTFRELLEDLSEFQKAIQSTLDRQDELDEGLFASSKRARVAVGSSKSLKRAATFEAHTSGGSGSDREHQNDAARVAASVGSSKSLKRATFEAPTSGPGSGGSGSDRSDREHPIHDQNSLGQLRLLAAVLGSPGVSTPGDPGSNLSEPLSDEQEPAAKRSGRRGDGAAPKRRRRRGDGAGWAAPEDEDKQHFTHYVLFTLVFGSPPTSNANLQTRTGGWKCEDFVRRYTEEFPNRASPKNFWSNSAVPAGLEVCWRRAKGLMAQRQSLGDSGVQDCIRQMAGLENGCDPWAGSVLQVRPSRPPARRPRAPPPPARPARRQPRPPRAPAPRAGPLYEKRPVLPPRGCSCTA